MKYLSLLCKTVEIKIAAVLPSTFALVFDAWTANSTHYVAMFATYPSTEKFQKLTRLFAYGR